jgi:hypothetical protein
MIYETRFLVLADEKTVVLDVLVAGLDQAYAEVFEDPPDEVRLRACFARNPSPAFVTPRLAAH